MTFFYELTFEDKALLRSISRIIILINALLKFVILCNIQLLPYKLYTTDKLKFTFQYLLIILSKNRRKS